MRRVDADLVGISDRPAIVDPQVLPVDPAEFTQSLLERADAGLCDRILGGQQHQHADPANPVGWLGSQGERRGHQRGARRDKCTPLHVATAAAGGETWQMGGRCCMMTVA